MELGQCCMKPAFFAALRLTLSAPASRQGLSPPLQGPHYKGLQDPHRPHFLEVSKGLSIACMDKRVQKSVLYNTRAPDKL